MQRSEKCLRLKAASVSIFGRNNFLCQQNSISGSNVSQEANETWFAVNDIKLPCLCSGPSDLFPSKPCKPYCHLSQI